MRTVIAHANETSDPVAHGAVHRAVPHAESRAVEGPDGYAKLFRELWLAGQPFVIIEHDVVPAPGQVDQIAGCSHDWCANGYGPGDHMPDTGIPLGLAKFRPQGPVPFDGLPHWEEVAAHIVDELHRRGMEVHQHFPPVAHIPGPRTTVQVPGPRWQDLDPKEGP